MKKLKEKGNEIKLIKKVLKTENEIIMCEST